MQEPPWTPSLSSETIARAFLGLCTAGGLVLIRSFVVIRKKTTHNEKTIVSCGNTLGFFSPFGEHVLKC